jgi:thiamine kinase-like enzyme
MRRSAAVSKTSRSVLRLVADDTAALRIVQTRAYNPRRRNAVSISQPKSRRPQVIPRTPPALLPDPDLLSSHLRVVFGNGIHSEATIKILDRQLPPFMCTFPNEIVTCQLPTGRKRRVFMKYGGGQSHESFGHRGDVGYEAEVYQQLLERLPRFQPKCLAAHVAGKTDSWLALEYIDRSVRLSDLTYRRALRQPRAMAMAAGWVGAFHRTQHRHSSDPALAFLKRYDADYYRGWAERTFRFSAPVQNRFPWLAKLRRAANRWFEPLLASGATVIHGEYYAKNLLVRGDELFILDWESAAIASGEIDLAALTEGIHWPAELVQMCEQRYLQARWPAGAPADFSATLDTARMYLHFRWLGERPDWTTREKSLWRFEHLHEAAQRLKLI